MSEDRPRNPKFVVVIDKDGEYGFTAPDLSLTSARRVFATGARGAEAKPVMDDDQKLALFRGAGEKWILRLKTSSVDEAKGYVDRIVKGE